VPIEQSDLDTCVRCGLCLSSCPTFELTGMEGYSPRGRIATARQLSTREGRLSPVVSEYLDTCLGCRACEAVCPAGVPYGRILEGARASVPPRMGVASRLMLWATARRWRLSLVTLPLWLAQRLGLLRLLAVVPGLREGLSGLPRLRLSNLVSRMSTNYQPPAGARERGQVVLFVGCVSDAWWRDVHWATIAVLTRIGWRVRVPYGQGCCGALHAHAGRASTARKLAARNVDPLEQFEGTIVVSAAGCGAKLKEYGEVFDHQERPEAVASRVSDVLEVIRPADIRRLGARPPEGLRRIAMHDACHHAFAQGIVSQPRALLEAAGYEVVDLADGGRCCGAAGSYSLSHPEWARPLRDAKVDAINATAPDAVAVANPGCELWISSAHDAPPVYHPVQLLAMALAAADPS
jgi:glycolate oxidase iron-sulfur subunit